jgi:hypothetical protein
MFLRQRLLTMVHRLNCIGIGVLAAGVLVCAGTWGQQVNEFPRHEDPLHVRVDMFDKLIRGNHWNEGAVMPHVIFPPAGKDTPIIGSQEDCPIHTGGYLAALSFRYAVTQEPEVRTWADQTMNGILKLESVTGQPGCVARSFTKTDAPNWHEQVFFFPMEWHESTALSGYRWMGDLSSDQFTGLIFGVTVYWELCADEAHKKIAADFIDRMMGRCIEHDFRIVDADNKMTLWGNFCPDLPHEKLNALLILAHLKTAHHVTGQAAYDTAYKRLITRYHYDDEAILAKVIWPEQWRNDGDDRLALMALYHLMRFEDNSPLLQKYRMSLNRHWSVWKDTDDPVFHMFYQALTGEKVMDDKTVARIKSLWGFDRERQTWNIPTPEGPKTVEAEFEDINMWLLPTYWFGRYKGLIDAGW